MEKYDFARYKKALEQQLRIATAELVVGKALANEAKKEKPRLEATFLEKHSKVPEEIRSFKEHLNQKEIYAGELVRELPNLRKIFVPLPTKLNSLSLHWIL